MFSTFAIFAKKSISRRHWYICWLRNSMTRLTMMSLYASVFCAPCIIWWSATRLKRAETKYWSCPNTSKNRGLASSRLTKSRKKKTQRSRAKRAKRKVNTFIIDRLSLRSNIVAHTLGTRFSGLWASLSKEKSSHQDRFRRLNGDATFMTLSDFWPTQDSWHSFSNLTHLRFSKSWKSSFWSRNHLNSSELNATLSLRISNQSWVLNPAWTTKQWLYSWTSRCRLS